MKRVEEIATIEQPEELPRLPARWLAIGAACAVSAAVLLVGVLLIRNDDGHDVPAAPRSATPVTSVPPTAPVVPATSVTFPAGSVDALIAAHPEVFIDASAGPQRPTVAIEAGKRAEADELLATIAGTYKVVECNTTSQKVSELRNMLHDTLLPQGAVFGSWFDANTCRQVVMLTGAKPEQVHEWSVAFGDAVQFELVDSLQRQ